MSRYHARNAARCSRARSLPRRKKEDTAVAKSASLSDQIISPVHLHSQFLHRLTATKPYVPPRALTTASAEIVNPFLQHRRTRLILVVWSRQRTFLDPTYTYARPYEREERSIKVFGKRVKRIVVEIVRIVRSRFAGKSESLKI